MRPPQTPGEMRPPQTPDRNELIYPALDKNCVRIQTPPLPPYQPIAEINSEFHRLGVSRIDAIESPSWQSPECVPIGGPRHFRNQSSYLHTPTQSQHADTNNTNMARFHDPKNTLRVIKLEKDKQSGQYGIVLLWTMFGIVIFRDQRHSKFSNPELRTFDRLLSINDEPVTGLKKREVYRLLDNKHGVNVTVTDHPLVRYYDIRRATTYESVGFTLFDGRYIKHVIPYSLASKCGMLENYAILSCNNIETWEQADSRALPQLLSENKRILLKTIPIFAFEFYLRCYHDLY